MRYFTVLRAVYLMAYYSVLSKRPNSNYTLSVMIACVSGFIYVIFHAFLLFFTSKDTKEGFPFESLLFHGLSYEEWRTAKTVKEKMDKVQILTNGEQSLPEDYYLALLLILSFSGLIEYRPETPEEKSDTLFGKLPSEGEILTGYTVTRSRANPTVTYKEHKVDRSEAEMYASIKQEHVDRMIKTHYQGTTLSRLVYDGVQIMFRRKKLGQKRPGRTNVFVKSFGIKTN